jgi:aldehyde:ferredoxin oxidoreductase
MAKILRVDLASRKSSWEEMPEGYSGLGGRGLTSAIVAAEVPPKADPLGPENVVVFAPGIIAGTSLPNSGRLSVGGKSPLTGTIKESNSGGSAARKLARLGIAALVLRGKSADPVMITITKDGVAFRPASSLWGLGNYAAVDRLKAEFPGTGLITIGPAGEKMLKAAAVVVTSPDYLLRTAARGGLGAVLGSKKVKAISVDDTDGPGVAIAAPKPFQAASKAVTDGVMKHPLTDGLRALGTSLLVGMMNEMGGLSTRNFSTGRFVDAEKIGGESLAATMSGRKGANANHSCMTGCVIQCSQVYTGKKGEFVTSGLEFETLGLVGSNCEIGDLDAIARIDRACDDIGLDTIDVGAAAAVAMEAGRIPWGDGARVLEVLESIRADDPLGLLIGNGCAVTGKALGAARVPVVKGQSLSAYDPRVLKGTGVTYATSPMGADHTCGNALPSPANPGYDPGSPSGQNQVSEFLQSYFAAVDTLGMCLFASIPILESPDLQRELIRAVAAKLGVELPDGYLQELGRGVVVAERAFNRLAGFGPGDDRLPGFIRKETLSPGGNVWDVPDDDLDKMFS